MTQKQAASLITAWAILLAGAVAGAQSLDDNKGPVEISEPTSPTVGRKAAGKYMGAKGPTPSPNSQRRRPASSSGDHYLAVHMGSFISDNSYQWGTPSTQSNVGSWNIGVTYRIGEWHNSMDLGLRVDLQSYSLRDGRANKLSFVPVITFPDSGAKFPLYFGGGVGFGVFTQQLPSESPLTLDYQLFAGVRFFDVINNTGFFVEAGLKNHFLVFSDGQFNGNFGALGCVFTF
jgi:hypothetical protein